MTWIVNCKPACQQSNREVRARCRWHWHGDVHVSPNSHKSHDSQSSWALVTVCGSIFHSSHGEACPNPAQRQWRFGIGGEGNQTAKIVFPRKSRNSLPLNIRESNSIAKNPISSGNLSILSKPGSATMPMMAFTERMCFSASIAPCGLLSFFDRILMIVFPRSLVKGSACSTKMRRVNLIVPDFKRHSIENQPPF